MAWGGGGGAGGGEAEEIQEDTSNVADWHKLPPSSGGLLYHFHRLVSKFDLGCECNKHVQGAALIMPGIAHEFGDGGKRWGGLMHHLPLCSCARPWAVPPLVVT